jgi:hypothetical protein
VTPLDSFLAGLDAESRGVLLGLDSPPAIQALLDGVTYSADPFYRCPARVLRDRLAHCFDGALFAAAALRRLGDPPVLIDLYAERDDDHLLAVFRRGGRWGAVAKSNFVGLRYREPVYRSLGELVMSYFESFYNVAREKTLRGYTLPLDLRRCDRLDWMSSDDRLEEIADRLDRLRRVDLLTPAQVAALEPVDERTFRAGLQGANEAGLYRPEDP